MATKRTTNTNSTKTTSRAKKGAAAAAPSAAQENVATVEVVKPEFKAVKRPKPNFELTDSVLIRNGYHGTLVIGLPKSGYTLKMQNFGDEDYVEIADLKTLRNSHPKFFKNNWILFDDPDVIDYLHINEFYKNTLNVEEIDDLFDLPTEELKSAVSKLSSGQKKTVMYAALEKIEDRTLDSRSKIQALEEVLGCSLVENME